MLPAAFLFLFVLVNFWLTCSRTFPDWQCLLWFHPEWCLLFNWHIFIIFEGKISNQSVYLGSQRASSSCFPPIVECVFMFSANLCNLKKSIDACSEWGLPHTSSSSASNFLLNECSQGMNFNMQSVSAGMFVQLS